MMKFIKSIIVVSVISFRVYCTYKIIKGLYLNHLENYPLDDLKWYVYFLILDLYVVNVLNNSISLDIYTKNSNESETDK